LVWDDHRDAVPGLRGLCAAADARDGTWSYAVVERLLHGTAKLAATAEVLAELA
jgi:hypothetical protein